MCEEIEKMKKAERIKIAQRIISSEKFTYDEIAYFTNLTLEKIKTLTNNEKGPALQQDLSDCRQSWCWR